MNERSLTPNITVTIGQHSRIYFAFVTTAPADLDSPATLTLHAASLADVAGFAAEPIALDTTRSKTPGRLILVDAMELAWQRAKCRGQHDAFLPADPSSSASTRCSTGSGNGFRPRPLRSLHDSQRLLGVPRSRQTRAAQEVRS